MQSSVEQEWLRRLPEWRAAGRVEDYPRGLRLPKYAPSAGKKAGVRFAEVFKDDFSFVVQRLHHGDDIEKLCAFEVLDYMYWEFGEAIPVEFCAIDAAIPPKILEELPFEEDSREFVGSTVGE